MFPKRIPIPIIALIAIPLVGIVFGVTLALCNPPQNHIDFWPNIYFLGGGMGGVGLLFGVLAWLWLRRRIPAIVAIAAITIPFTIFGSFWGWKSGRWDIAGWLGFISIAAMLLFFVRSVVAIESRDVERQEENRGCEDSE